VIKKPLTGYKIDLLSGMRKTSSGLIKDEVFFVKIKAGKSIITPILR